MKIQFCKYSLPMINCVSLCSVYPPDHRPTVYGNCPHNFIHWNCSTNQGLENSRNSTAKPIRLEELWLVALPNLSSIRSVVCLQMCGNCSTNQRPKKRNFVECDQKLIGLGEAHNELARQIWAQSDQQLVCKFIETAQPRAGIQWSMTKS